MSPRAAWRLADLGHTSVFDYVAGKADWLAYGGAWSGSAQLIQPHVTHDVATCHPDESLRAVRQRLDADEQDTVIVVNQHHIVLGQLDAATLGEHKPDVRAGQVMTEGPTTVRPSEEVGPLLGRMTKAQLQRIIVTYPDGRLVGAFHREDAPRPA